MKAQKKKRRYLPIRSVPMFRDGKFISYKSHQKYTDALKSFFKDHKICDQCNGEGFTIDEDILVLEKNEMININYSDIDELIELKESGINLSDKIKLILEQVWWNRKQCKKCHGSGFIKK